MSTHDDVPCHPSGIHPRIVAKVFRRRGRLHAYEALRAKTTALVVIDLTVGSVENDANCAQIVPAINELAHTLRALCGMVAFVRPSPSAGPDPRLVEIVGGARASHFAAQARADDPRAGLADGVHVATGDAHATKSGASAFFPGKCALHTMLHARGIDTVLICGTVTNVCCESSARDAVELGYNVIMVSDALAGHAFGLHEAVTGADFVAARV